MGFKVGFTDAFRLGIDFAYEKERFRKAGIEFEVHNCNTEDDILEQMQAVSYTHLTLPTT